MQTFRANGKLLLSGEYVVLDGALALALPTHFGQDMMVHETDTQTLEWESLNHEGRPWFRGTFSLKNGKYQAGTDPQVGDTLAQMWACILKEKPGFLLGGKGFHIQTRLDFPRDWGLGSSSTLIYNLSQWTGVDAYQILRASLGGSGYDIACAGAASPLLYQLQDGQPVTRASSLSLKFREHLYFVHLGKKQDSRSGIQLYRKKARHNPQSVSGISILTQRMVNATTVNEFKALVRHHEKVISQLLELNTAKELHFPDFWGEVKSLGAWGGDFVMAISQEDYVQTQQYFKEKGFHTFFAYDEIILH